MAKSSPDDEKVRDGDDFDPVSQKQQKWNAAKSSPNDEKVRDGDDFDPVSHRQQEKKA